VLIYSAVSRCSLCPRTRSCHHLWLLLVIAPQERTCFPRTPHHALFLSALLAHRAARSIDPHRSIRCTPLRAITQSPRPSQCHLSTSGCSGERRVESPTRRCAIREQYIEQKCLKCGWDCLILNESAPYASTHPLLPYTLIALLAFIAITLSSRHTPSRTRTTVRWSRNHRCRRHLLLPNSVLLSTF
jgi:hypothetical protein